MCISTSSYLFSSSIVLVSGLYFKKRSSTLYIVITAGEVVKVNSHTTGKAAIVKLELATRKAANCQLTAAR